MKDIITSIVSWSDKQAELVSVRRAVFIGLGRHYDFDRIPRAGGFAGVAGRCHTFNEERIEEAARVHGTVRNLRDVDPDTLATARPSAD